MAMRPDDRYGENAEAILGFLTQCQSAGTDCALCVVTDVSGGSARAVGTMVAVRADGAMVGYVSHGCIDADLALQAQDAMINGQVRQLIYGTGSPFVDLRLPCGGTVQILVDPKPDAAACAQAMQTLRDRQPICLRFTIGSGLETDVLAFRETGWAGREFAAAHVPEMRLVVAGSGPVLAAVARVCDALRVPVDVLSPKPDAAGYVAGMKDARFRHLLTPDAILDLGLDPWTAVLLLFHEHDWEPALLRASLMSAPFYIGALGSDRTHVKRLAALRDLGVSDADLSRITGPIGVIPAAREAPTLAISALAQILDDYRLVPNVAR